MEQVIGSIVNEFGFRIDNRSWRQLDKFQKRISQLKKQMKGLGGISVGNITGASGANVAGSRGKGSSRDGAKKRQTAKRNQMLFPDADSAQSKELSKLREHYSKIEAAQKSHNSKMRNENSKKFSSHVKNMTRGSGAGSAKDSLLAEQLRQEQIASSVRNKAHGQANAFSGKADVKQQRETFELGRLGLSPDKYKQAKSAVDGLTNSFKNGKITLQEYNSKLAQTRKQYTDMSRRQKTLTGGMRDLRSMLVQITATMTAFAAGQAIMRTGQDFERMGVSMLAASDNADQAASNLKYVRKEANRLGLDLVSANRGFVQLAANINKDFGNKNLRELFSGVSELATTLQLPAEDVQGTFRAISQMFGKNKIMAEEARQQLGERLPKAMKLLAEAAHRAGETTDNQVSSLEALMQRGKALPDKILPAFSKVAKEFARNNGALEKSLKTNRIALNRLTTEFKDFQNILFKSGFGEGLTALFNNIAVSLKDLNPAAKVFGKIFSGAIKAVSAAVRIGASILGGFFTIAEKLFGTAFGEWFGAAGATALGVVMITKLATAFRTMAGGIALANAGLLIMMRRLFLILAPALALEDILGANTGKRSLIGGDPISQEALSKGRKEIYGFDMKSYSGYLMSKFQGDNNRSGNKVQVDVNLKSDMLEAEVNTHIDKKNQESINQQLLSVGE